MVQQVVGQRGQRVTFAALTNAVSPNAIRRLRRVLVLELSGRGHEQADQQRALERGHQPQRADRQPLGSGSCRQIAASTVSCAGQNGSRRRAGGG